MRRSFFGLNLFDSKMSGPLAILFLAASLAPAQPPDGAGAQTGDDPPGRAARLSFLAGTVSFQPGGVEDWVPATLNRPLTTGDRLWTEGGSRAELHLGSAALRINGRTNLTFINLNDNITQVQVSTGSLSVRLRRLDDQENFEIDTPQVAFSLLRPGEYRVDVNEQGDATLVTVRGGQGELAAGGQLQPVRPRQQVRITGTGDAPPIFDARDAPVADPFDNFCQNRDRREDRSESARYVSREMPGYADLDEYGGWRQDPVYGSVWAPRVEVGWAPYHNGHWAWIAPWGWTWVDDAPWGYAPFHYGRWANAGGAWVWVPGPIAVRPVYAPALVAWVGGPRFGVSLAIGGGVGAVGWFALGPGELWAPAYRASPRYFNQVNVSNTVVNRNVNITNVYNNVYVNKTVNNNVTYVNQNVNGAVTAVPQNAMVSGRSVAQASVRVPPNAVAAAQVQQAAFIAPQRGAVLSGAATTTVAPPESVRNRAVVARSAPPPPPVSFAQQQSALQQNPGQPLNRAALSQIQSTQPAPQGVVQQRPLYRPAQPNQQGQFNSGGFGGPGPGGQGQRGQNPAGQAPVIVQPPPGQTPPGQNGAGQSASDQNPAGQNPAGRNPAVFQPNRPRNAQTQQENVPPPSAPNNQVPRNQQDARPQLPQAQVPQPQVQQPQVQPQNRVPPNRQPPAERPIQAERPVPAERPAPPPRVNPPPQGNPPPRQPQDRKDRRDEKRDNKREER